MHNFIKMSKAVYRWTTLGFKPMTAVVVQTSWRRETLFSVNYGSSSRGLLSPSARPCTFYHLQCLAQYLASISHRLVGSA